MQKKDRKTRLFTVFVNHLKSHFVPFNSPDPVAEAKGANEHRKRQCEAAAKIIAAEMRPDSSFLVVGDMNDPEDSEFLKPLVASTKLKLVSGIDGATETQPAPRTKPATHRALD